jgi:hypothetical protein
MSRPHAIWRVNLVNRLDPDGATRDFIDRRIAQAFGYPEPRRDDKAEPPTSEERQHPDG